MNASADVSAATALGEETEFPDGRGHFGPYGGRFVAETLLAKHDENYIPRELEGIDMTAGQHKSETLIQ